MVCRDQWVRSEILSTEQWRRQDLLRGGAKMSWGTGELKGRLQQLIDD